jgi:hypothetical protein
MDADAGLHRSVWVGYHSAPDHQVLVGGRSSSK